MKKYSIGIDLGTTNSVLAYAELVTDKPSLQLMRIEQVSAPNETEARDSLPSFLYLATAQECESGAFSLATAASEKVVVGDFARRVSAEKPERTIIAAKSWLCHGGVDRHSPILPWNDEEVEGKLSPVNASKFILQQLVASWNQEFPEHPFSEQRVTLTVPASFDMAARELTREAALAAGLPADFILLEEPQAAVYHWLDSIGDEWRSLVKKGDEILVCDVGGGTTDLTLVKVEEHAGDLELKRQAVGNHLLVGGDNMDLALAHLVAQKFADKGTKLNPWQSVSLWHSCRRAKEALLAEEGKETETISVLGRGSKLIGGTVSVEVNREEIQSFLIDGFLPLCNPDDKPVREPNVGLQEIGLPFETDSAITRHISAFLSTHGETDDDQSSVHLLLNGGVFKAPALRTRAREAVAKLLSSDDLPSLLGGPADLDHAVARGAAFYGWTKECGGVRIRAGAARSYYVGIETAGLAIPGMPRPLQAVCVVPFGMEEGTEVEVPGKEVGLVVGREARFRFFAAADRKEDQPGVALKEWTEEELIETSPLEVSLETEDMPEEGFIPVRFCSKLSELGVLELWCQSTRSDEEWKLELHVRDDAEATA